MIGIVWLMKQAQRIAISLLGPALGGVSFNCVEQSTAQSSAGKDVCNAMAIARHWRIRISRFLEHRKGCAKLFDLLRIEGGVERMVCK